MSLAKPRWVWVPLVCQEKKSKAKGKVTAKIEKGKFTNPMVDDRDLDDDDDEDPAEEEARMCATALLCRRRCSHATLNHCTCCSSLSLRMAYMCRHLCVRDCRWIACVKWAATTTQASDPVR